MFFYLLFSGLGLGLLLFLVCVLPTTTTPRDLSHTHVFTMGSCPQDQQSQWRPDSSTQMPHRSLELASPPLLSVNCAICLVTEAKTPELPRTPPVLFIIPHSQSLFESVHVLNSSEIRTLLSIP